MNENTERIHQLSARLDSLIRRYEAFHEEITYLQREIESLKSNSSRGNNIVLDVPSVPPPIPSEKVFKTGELNIGSEVPEAVNVPVAPKPVRQTNIEKTIGENLISKIGIAITIIGVAIGAKYSIDRDLISPLARILLGYGVGLGLYAIGFRLKRQYENYSAVLVSGAIAIGYFMTYLAYSFYALIPQVTAFAMMAGFTAFTVYTAIRYNKQVIANIGLVGAYAIPFLLSQGEGRAVILFSYITIINMGILLIAWKKYWKSVYYSSFLLTWLIFSLWFFAKYDIAQPFGTAFLFLCIFFLVFYAIFLVYKLIQNENFVTEDIFLLLANSFLFYGLGYALLSKSSETTGFIGLFTLGNAFIHSVVSMIVYRKQLADKNLFYLVAGLVLIFITIAIPVQLDGNWVTLLWAGEAAILFWIGRSRNVRSYERLSYPLMILAFFSIVHDWFFTGIGTAFLTPSLTPFFNVHFLSGLLFTVAFVFINRTHRLHPVTMESGGTYKPDPAISFLVQFILLAVLYVTFRQEIALYWDQLYDKSAVEIQPEGQEYAEQYRNESLMQMKQVWLMMYTMFFITTLAVVNDKMIRSQAIATVCLSLAVIVLAVFLTQGLSVLDHLREAYYSANPSDRYPVHQSYIYIRYVSFLFAGLLLFALYRFVQGFYTAFRRDNAEMVLDLLAYGTLIWIASSELVVWMDYFKSAQPDKLGLSILWGIFALLIIAIGMWKQKKYLRIAAIILFGATLVKLLFYDISHLNTIAKTIVFVSLGILLLIISFLYNKYKNRIFDDNGVRTE